MGHARLTKKVTLASQTLQADLLILKSEYNEALNLLIELEGNAASSGYLPIAMKSAILQADVYNLCGKTAKGRETISRVRTYIDNLISTIPENNLIAIFLKSPVMLRLKNVDYQIRSKELISV